MFSTASGEIMSFVHDIRDRIFEYNVDTKDIYTHATLSGGN